MFKFLPGLLDSLNTFLWGWFMIVLLLGVHIFCTIRTGFIQKRIGLGIRLSLRKHDPNNPGDVSHFGSLMMALAATIGVGNIVGVATAVCLGGPGAVLWCWVTGVLGIATKYSEGVLAIKYRRITEKGTWIGGPMLALERGVGSKLLAVVFCVLTVLASFGIGNMVQANTLSDAVNISLGVPAWLSGVVVAAIVAVVVIGGVRSIAAVCRRVVPFMAALYVIGCVTLLAINWQYVIPALELIVRSAISSQALTGGLAGAGIMLAARYGIARGLFSNESGMGSAPIAAAAAKTKLAAEQGLVSMTGTFWDTVVICALTGMALVSSMLREPAAFAGLQGVQVTYQAFAALPMGRIFLMVSLVFFTFSTLLGWSYYGERCIEYLSGNKGIMAYRAVWVVLVYVGATTTLQNVWNFSDMANALMVLPNVVALVALNKVTRGETRDYFRK